VFISFFFALKVKLKVKVNQLLGVESQVNLQLTGKISLEFDFRSSLLL